MSHIENLELLEKSLTERDIPYRRKSSGGAQS